jgi:hypothetical protein
VVFKFIQSGLQSFWTLNSEAIVWQTKHESKIRDALAEVGHSDRGTKQFRIIYLDYKFDSPDKIKGFWEYDDSDISGDELQRIGWGQCLYIFREENLVPMVCVGHKDTDRRWGFFYEHLLSTYDIEASLAKTPGSGHRWLRYGRVSFYTKLDWWGEGLTTKEWVERIDDAVENAVHLIRSDPNDPTSTFLNLWYLD